MPENRAKLGDNHYIFACKHLLLKANICLLGDLIYESYFSKYTIAITGTSKGYIRVPGICKATITSDNIV